MPEKKPPEMPQPMTYEPIQTLAEQSKKQRITLIFSDIVNKKKPAYLEKALSTSEHYFVV